MMSDLISLMYSGLVPMLLQGDLQQHHAIVLIGLLLSEGMINLALCHRLGAEDVGHSDDEDHDNDQGCNQGRDRRQGASRYRTLP
jgi:hypothetical protein